jgi:dipeptidyl aminopeptidase/acylaminoacyl peptidase
MRMLVLAGLLLAGAATSAPAPAARGGSARPASSPRHVYPLEQYMKIRRSDGPSFSPDGTRILISSNASGTWQPCIVAASGGTPRQVATVTSMGHAQWRPRSDSILVVADRGGDQKNQFYLMSASTGDTALLTDGRSKNDFGAWTPDGRLITYASNARDERFFDVYVMDVAARRADRVCQRDAVLHAAAISADGRWVAAEETHSEVDDDLLLIDTRSCDARVLTAHPGHARFITIGFSPDAATLYYRTNVGCEFIGVVARRLADGTTRTVFSGLHDVDDAVLSPDGRRLAIGENVEGFERLTVLDLAARPPATAQHPPLPPGIAIPMRFSADSRRLAVMLSRPVHDDDVWTVDVATNRVRRVTDSDMGGIDPQDLVLPTAFRYRSFDGRAIPALLYVPPGASARHPAPVLVSVHGGPEDQERPYLTNFDQYFVSQGYAVLAPNVRGSTGYGASYVALDDGPLRWNALRDVAYAVRWIRSQPRFDGRRVAVFGFSYGGFTTLAMLAHFPKLFAAGVDFYGPADLRSFLNRTAEYRRPNRIAEYGDPVRDSTFLNAISPARHADRIRRPLLVIQGENDPIVPKAESEDIVRLVQEDGGTAELLVFPNEGHGFSRDADLIKAFETMSEFLRRTMPVAPTVPVITEADSTDYLPVRP